jgi:transcription elongation GreA/GreB family factor
MMDKSALIKAIQNQLHDKLESTLAEALAAKEAATNEESKAENKYDTRGLEASYIAGAQAKRVAQFREDLYNLSKVDLKTSESIRVGSLAEVFHDQKNESFFYFLLPCGGVTVDFNGKTVKSLSPTSPLGQKLLGLFCEDAVSFRGENLEVVQIF